MARKGLIDNVAGFARRAFVGMTTWAHNPNDAAWTEAMKAAQVRRAIYDCDLATLFPDWKSDKEKLLVPDTTLRELVDKIASNVFPCGTVLSVKDEAANELLQAVIEATKLDNKFETIVRESLLNPFVGLRSVWNEELENWLIEIKPYEHLEVVFDSEVKEIIRAIYVCYPKSLNGARLWYREKWTADEFWTWPLQAEMMPGIRPEFKEDDPKIVKEPNTFGRIPITLVTYKFSCEEVGEPLIRDGDIHLARALVRLQNKRHYAHLEHGDPTLVTIDAESDGPIQRGVGAHIALTSSDNKSASAELLESSGIPESYVKEIQDKVDALFNAAGMTSPNLEEKAGAAGGSGVPSGKALKIRDKGEEDTITNLRSRSYTQILRHLEMLLKLGAALRKTPEYKAIREADPETWTIEAKYPEFFPLSQDEILVGLEVLSQSHLSAKAKGEREAQLLGEEDPAEIEEIIKNIEEEASLAKTTNLASAGLVDDDGNVLDPSRDKAKE